MLGLSSCLTSLSEVKLCSRAGAEGSTDSHILIEPRVHISSSRHPCPWSAASCTRRHRDLLFISPLLPFSLSEDKGSGCPQGSESMVQRNREWHPLLPQWNFEWRIDQANSYHCGNHDVSSLCERINLL